MARTSITTRLPRDAGLHLAILIGGAALYVLVRIGIDPHSGWLRNHVTDFLAGVMLPSLFALWASPPRSVATLTSDLSGKLILVASAAVVWEVIEPMVTRRSTGDWRDVLAYLAGAIVQHLITLAAALRGPRSESLSETDPSASQS